MPSKKMLTPKQAAAKRMERKKALAAAQATKNAEKAARFRVTGFKVTPAEIKRRVPNQYNKHAPILFGAMAAKTKNIRGVPIQSLTMTPPNRLQRALLVRNNRDPNWGAIKAIEFNRGSDETMYDAELTRLKMSWINNGHFGGDAEWDIRTIEAPRKTSTY